MESLGTLRRITSTHNIDVIYSTHSPPSNHLPGWLLSRDTRRPWVAEFRDLWTDDFRYPFVQGLPWRPTMDKYFQRRFQDHAQAVDAASPPQTRVFSDHLPHRRCRFVTLTNGLDLNGFRGIDRRPQRRGQRMSPAWVSPPRLLCQKVAPAEARAWGATYTSRCWNSTPRGE